MIKIRNFSITILRKRLLAIIIAVAFLFLCVFGRLFYVQVIWGEDLQEKAIDQWTREIPVVATRGKIVDTNGVVLVNNDDTYTVFVRKKAVEDVNELAKTLSETLQLDYDFVYNRLTKTKEIRGENMKKEKNLLVCLGYEIRKLFSLIEGKAKLDYWKIPENLKA